MSYQVLARKYRPQSFDDIIGQTHVATTLANALRSGKVAHAYLFSGPRGVGKTTTARLLAKALNCEKGPTPTPCNHCDACLRIAQGQEMVDVLEIDAASNRGIEEIRELRDNVRYAPARSRYKVYIVDEAHQITHDAFNAFLKTLEEPPAHAVFILATTEHQKIPATILSRCQLFRFKRVSVEEITGRLEKILASEKITAEPAALVRLARAAGGSVRDALSLLDQALAYTPDGLTAKQVEVLLGFLPDEFLEGFVSALLERKPAGVLEWTRQLADEGWELPQFVRDFREFLRQRLIEQLSIGAPGRRSAGDTSKEASPRPRGADAPTQPLTLAGRPTSLAEVLQMIKVFGHCLDDMRWNDNPQLVLELYSLRLTQPFVDAGELLKRIEQIEKMGAGASEPRSLGEEAETFSPPIRVSPTASSVLEPRNPERPAPEVPLTPRRPDAPMPAAAPQTKSPGDPAAQWRQWLAELWKRPAVASQLERAFLKSSTETEWLVAFPDKFALDSAQRSMGFLNEMLTKVTGSNLRLKLIQESGERRETDPMVVSVPAAAGESAKSNDPGVQKVLDVFKGRISADINRGRWVIAMSSSLEQLRQRLALLPGVGPKMAERLAIHLLRAPEHEVVQLIRALEEARRQVLYCPICFTLTEESPCRICADETRDAHLLCVVENPPDVEAFEKTKAFRGRYHVLHGSLSPLDGIGPHELKVAELFRRMQAEEIREVIICTDPTLAGETTATYLAEKLHPFGARVTRIGYGLPMGGDIEYTDELTLTRALEGRREM